MAYRILEADNNFAGRELRPLVMARKVSFGSHSDNYKKILIFVLKTLKLRNENDVRTNLKNFLDKFAENPKLDVYLTLFPMSDL